MNDHTKRIAILPGRGGVGKTKLLRDWAPGVIGWHQLWVNPHGTWSEESATEIPNHDTILIADNAHHYNDLEKLISYVATSTAGGMLKLIIATRPSGQNYVDDVVGRVGDENFIQRFDSLKEPAPTRDP